MKKKVLMVCFGNICRSPMAEAILRHKIQMLSIIAEVDSCGFEAFHVGDSPDPRAQETLRKQGITMGNIRSRLFKSTDFDDFDYIYVMDANNFADVSLVARNPVDMQKVAFIRNTVSPGKNMVVSDPYYGGQEGFEKVFKELDEATEKICSTLQS
jgi:protein-tyrosine phosphatase